MLADSSVYSSSPWQNDLPLFPNYDLDNLEADIERMRNESSLTSELLTTESTQVSSWSSAASSEGDYLDLCLRDEDLDGTVFNAILDDSLPNQCDVDWTTWMASDEDGACADNSSVISSTSSSSSSPKAKRRCKRTSKKSKPKEKRKSSVEQLQHIISTQLGVREQLDILRIIDPYTNNVSPTDKHFAIDLDKVTEEKLKQVKEYVNRHSNSNSKCSSATTQKHLSKLTKKQQAQQQREERQYQRKIYRQTQKEKRSGLFKKEQVLSLIGSGNRVDEEDIDILS